ncbi:MAG: YCF48-related protein [Armatimonadota bacterium]
MRGWFSHRAGPLGAALAACALLAAMFAAPASANVYATDLKFSAPAVDATQPNPSVQLSFRLNEAADQEVRIDIHRADNDALVRSVSLGPLPKGLNTWTWDLRNNANALVPTNVEYYFKVYTRGSGYGAWTQISDDNVREVQFEFPRGVDVNKDPNSPLFGRIYVLQARTATTVSGRPTGNGAYALNADTTDALGQGDTAFSGGVPWTTSTSSPYRLIVGPEGKIYFFDFTDTNGGVWVAPPDLSGNWTALLDPADISNSGGGSAYPFDNGAESPPAIHGSVSTGLVLGKGLNRVLYTVDEDIVPAGGPLVSPKGSIWMYPIGPLDKTYKEPPAIFWNDAIPNQIVNFACDLERDAAGNFWISQYRSNGTDVFSLARIAPDGNPANNYAPTWRSLAAWGSPDPLRNNAAGIAIYEPAKRIASAGTFSGIVNVFNFDETRTPIQATLTTVGGGALVWLAGANSSLYYSTNIGASFTAQTAPEPGVALNAISIANSLTTGLNGWAVGNGGKIFQLDNRTTWSSVPSGTTENLNAVTSIWNSTTPPVVHGWAVGNNGTILSNTAGSWVTEVSPVTVKLNGISRRISSFAGPAYDLYVVGDGGTIIRRLDASNIDTPTQWEIQTSGTTANLNAISMVVFATGFGSTTGYVVGDNGTILKTTNGGAEWVAQTSGTTAKLNSVYAVTALAAYAVGDGGTILRTTDGGATWTSLNSGTTANLRSVYFRDVQTGWVVGDGGVTLRTLNGGNTWSVISGTGTANLTGVAALATGSGNPRDVAFDAVGNLYVVDNIAERLRIYSPPDGVNEYTTKSVARFVPTAGSPAKPATPVVTAPASSSSANQLSASWTATGVAYRYAIGVTAEDQGDYIVPWTNTTSTSVTRTGLSLENGVTYFWYVQARSANNVWSDVGISNGTIVQAPTKIGLAKSKPNNASVTLENVVVTKLSLDEGMNPDGFFVQEQDQSAGVRVKWSGSAPPLNTLVTVVGTMGTEGPERVVNATSVVTGASFTPTPLGVTNKTAGGSKPTGGAGLPNDGLLATVWGKVTGIDFATTTFYLDDGSGVENDTPTAFVPNKVAGIKVKSVLATPFTTGSYYKVTGIVRLEQVGDKVIRRLDARSDEDIELVNP